MANIEISTLTRNNDGNTYIIKDANAIPKTGSNQISGSLIPATDNSVNLGDSTYGFANFYTNKIYLKDSTIFKLVDDNYICIGGSTAQANGANLVLNGKNRSTSTGEFKLEARDGTNTKQLIGKPDGTLNWNGNIIPSANDTYNLGSSSYSFQYVNARIIRQNNLSDSLFLMGAPEWIGGASISLFGKNNTTLGGGFRLDAHNGTVFQRLQGSPDGTLSWSGGIITSNNDNGRLIINGGSGSRHGATLYLAGKDFENGIFQLTADDGTNDCRLRAKPDGTLSWTGTAIQYTSDQRLKQQITQIDDDLLTAWEDVNPVQFKYNDAVEQKGKDNARLHTGYVVQQIDEACKKHNVDVSKYGLYCHEVYQEETREVEQADGTKKTEVVRPANEHYSLRYTEALIVECAYLRRENSRLKERLSKIEKLLNI